MNQLKATALTKVLHEASEGLMQICLHLSQRHAHEVHRDDEEDVRRRWVRSKTS
jgi:hypothetical protein